MADGDNNRKCIFRSYNKNTPFNELPDQLLTFTAH